MSYLHFVGLFALPDYNYRDLFGWRNWFHINYSQWRWVRRLIGGKWELWYVDPCRSAMWIPVKEWSTSTFRPPVTSGKAMNQEEWPKPPVIDGQRGPYR